MKINLEMEITHENAYLVAGFIKAIKEAGENVEAFNKLSETGIRGAEAGETLRKEFKKIEPSDVEEIPKFGDPNLINKAIDEVIKSEIPVTPKIDMTPPVAAKEQISTDPGLTPPVETKPTIDMTPPVNKIESATELDSRGFPWDARIHSAGDSRKLKTGAWKYKRNTPREVIDSVEAELQQLPPSQGTINTVKADGVEIKQDMTPPSKAVILTFPDLVKFVTTSNITPTQQETIAKKYGQKTFLHIGMLAKIEPDILEKVMDDLEKLVCK